MKRVPKSVNTFSDDFVEISCQVIKRKKKKVCDARCWDSAPLAQVDPSCWIIRTHPPCALHGHIPGPSSGDRRFYLGGFFQWEMVPDVVSWRPLGQTWAFAQPHRGLCSASLKGFLWCHLLQGMVNCIFSGKIPRADPSIKSLLWISDHPVLTLHLDDPVLGAAGGIYRVWTLKSVCFLFFQFCFIGL